MLNEDGLLYILPGHFQSRYQPDQDFRKEKTEEETEMEPEIKENPLETEPKAGTSNILKSLWFPPSTTPTRKSGQIVYGCASLLGEQWDFPLVIF